jgi:hypothetical protein
VCFLYRVGKPIGGKLGIKSLVFDFVKNHFASTVTEYPLCWFTCISYLTNPKRRENGENDKTRMQYTRECFFHFYGYQDLYEEEKDLKLKKYKGFVLATEKERFTSFFQTDVNVFKFKDKQNCYSKQHSYVCSSQNRPLYTLNVGLIDFPQYQHAVWLDKVEKACSCFACNKWQMRVFHNYNTYNAHERHCKVK